MTALDLFPDHTSATTQVMFTNFGTKEELACLSHLKMMRAAGINAEIYPDSVLTEWQKVE